MRSARSRLLIRPSFWRTVRIRQSVVSKEIAVTFVSVCGVSKIMCRKRRFGALFSHGDKTVARRSTAPQKRNRHMPNGDPYAGERSFRCPDGSKRATEHGELAGGRIAGRISRSSPCKSVPVDQICKANGCSKLICSGSGWRRKSPHCHPVFGPVHTSSEFAGFPHQYAGLLQMSQHHLDLGALLHKHSRNIRIVAATIDGIWHVLLDTRPPTQTRRAPSTTSSGLRILM